MISHICGKVVDKKDSSIVLEVHGISYEIWLPPAVMNSLDRKTQPDESLRLVTYHYHQVDQSRSLPVLIGFFNDVEKDFFEQFITVSGIGPKAACRALSLPFSVIADAIDKGDIGMLKTLPGIGEQRAREIVAKLQGKVARFCLIRDKGGRPPTPKIKEDIRQEALAVLLQLQYRKKEAEDMINRVMARNLALDTCEDILNEVYRQKSNGKINYSDSKRTG